MTKRVLDLMGHAQPPEMLRFSELTDDQVLDVLLQEGAPVATAAYLRALARKVRELERRLDERG